MYIIDLEKGIIEKNGEEIDLKKENCIVGQKGEKGIKKIAISCGENKKEKLMEKMREL